MIEARVYRTGSEGELAAAVPELQAYAREFDRSLGEHDFYCGEFSVADIGSFVFVSTAISLGVSLPPDAPRIAAWMARVAARPAVAAVMTDVTAAAARLLAA